MRYWQLCHVLTIVAHFGMAIAGFVSFVIAGQQSVDSFGSSHSFSDAQQEQRSSTDHVILPWATFGVAGLSLSTNLIALIVMSVLEFKRSSTRTQRRLAILKVFIILTIIGNFILGAADAILLGYLANRVHLYSVLGAPLALAAISAFFAIATAGFYIAHYRTCSKQQPPAPPSWTQSSYGYQVPSGGRGLYNDPPPYGNQSSWPHNPIFEDQPNNDYQIKQREQKLAKIPNEHSTINSAL